jgi:hypothetical protein
MMVEVAAQRMLTNRPTVALTSDWAIWPVAGDRAGRRSPRTEIPRPKDVTNGWAWRVMRLGQGITVSRWLERLSLRSSGLIKSATFRRDFPGRAGRLTWIDGCMENRRFGASAPMRVPLTVDSPSATRADREAVFANHARSGTVRHQLNERASAEARRRRRKAEATKQSFFLYGATMDCFAYARNDSLEMRHSRPHHPRRRVIQYSRRQW